MGLGEIPIRQPPALSRRTCILSSHLFRILYNLVPDLVKVVELLSGQMEELSPFVCIVLVQLQVGHPVLWLVTIASRFARRWPVDEL
jgi:hypothetical protein